MTGQDGSPAGRGPRLWLIAVLLGVPSAYAISQLPVWWAARNVNDSTQGVNVPVKSLEEDPVMDYRDAADRSGEYRALATSSDSGLPVDANGMAVAVFAGGCFWCTEAAFEQLAGVLDVESGYAGGSKATATYEQVCRGDTRHAEVIRITYDPQRISYERLLDVFFDAHDPTQLNRQGNDIGTQYRSTIFYADNAQKQAASEKIAQLTAAKAFSRAIVTTLEPLKEFYPAEAYHQDFARLNPNHGYIVFQSLPKVCKIRDKYTDLVNPSAVGKE
jgi:methionine-S-sulfoxide reductase